MENIEVIIYLVIIGFYFLFNYVVNNILGKKQPGKQESAETTEEPFDPADPFGENAPLPESRGSGNDARERGRLSDGDIKPEERTDLGEESTFMPGEGSAETEASASEARETAQRDVSYQSARDDLHPRAQQFPAHKPRSTGTGKRRKKKRKGRKFRFDPVQAVIYSEILRRPDY